MTYRRCGILKQCRLSNYCASQLITRLITTEILQSVSCTLLDHLIRTITTALQGCGEREPNSFTSASRSYRLDIIDLTTDLALSFSRLVTVRVIIILSFFHNSFTIAFFHNSFIYKYVTYFQLFFNPSPF